MGGVAASLALAGRGHSVCLVEETDWIGGQATAGGVSALDENRFIEFAGGTRSYYEFRNRIRDTYRRNQALRGGCRLGELESRFLLRFTALFRAEGEAGSLRDMLRGKRVALHADEDFCARAIRLSIASALAWRFERGEGVRIEPRFVLDATEMGDLLPLAKIPYVIGSEAKAAIRASRMRANGRTALACRASLIRSYWSGAMATAAAEPPDYEAARGAAGIFPARELSGGKRVEGFFNTACSAKIRRFLTTCRPARSFRGGGCWRRGISSRRSA